MKRLAVLATLLCPTIAAAQSVTVLGGEHGDFTRLVLYLPDEVDWRLEPSEDGRLQTLLLGREGWTLDISRTFDRIGRDRVASLETGPGSLAMEIACRCSIEAFRVNADLLVVDIAPDEGQAPEIARSEKPAETVKSVDLAGAASLRASALAPLLPRFELPSGAVDTQRVSDIAASIAGDIGRAASSGLLEPSMRPTPSAPRPEPLDLPVYGPTAQASGGTRQLDFGDRDGVLTIGGRTCAPDRDLQIEAWADTGSMGDMLGETRGNLFAEFDRVDAAAVRRHAQHLLHYGFGVEARAVLELGTQGDAGVLHALSFIMDGDPDPFERFKGQESCPGAAALWGVLALGAEGTGSVNVNAVLQTFDTLPDHLKADLGQQLATRLVDLGESGAASAVLRRAQRALGGSTPGLDLLLSRLDLQSGKTAEATVRLDGIIAQQAPEASDALVATVDIADSGNSPVPKKLVEMAEALAAERRMDDSGPELWRAHALSLILNSDFTEAYSVLQRTEAIPPETRDEIAERAVLAMAEKADTPTFLKLAFSEETTMQAVKPGVAVAVAARMLDLGLAEPALETLGHAQGTDNDRTVALLSAQAHLTMAQPERAEILLIGLQGPEAERLRAEARSMMGDHVRAAQLHVAVGDTEAARRATWLSGEWDKLADTDGDGLARAAALADDAGPGLPTEDGLLGAERLAEQSAQARSILDELLAGTRLATE